MKDFLTGILVLFLITIVSYKFSAFLNPHNHLSFLEWVGILGILVVIKTGIDIYNEEQK